VNAVNSRISPACWLFVSAVMGIGWGESLSVRAAEKVPPTPPATPQRSWSRGPSTNEAYFPIGVWLQSPANAARYKAAGINLYVGLWNGPTEEQLAVLKSAGMSVICAQNAVGLKHREDPTIIGWMHGDEPDNAQEIPGGKGYGPPIPPERIREDYLRLRAADPTRPVLLNLGQGTAWDDYIGRGVRRNHPEDYPRYIEGSDIVSFDIYPVVHPSKEIAGRLEFVARGVERLVNWAGPTRTVWNCIECTHISNPKAKATPAQVRSEVWMSLIRGSRGLIYFVHQFEPEFREAALLDDPEMLEAVTAINREIRELAPVLNGPEVVGGVTVTTTTSTGSAANGAMAWSQRVRSGQRYLFAVNLGSGSTRAAFMLKDIPSEAAVEVLGERRKLAIENGRFADEFGGYAVHLYRLRAGARLEASP
jgi:hypothetical protein